MLHIPAYSQRSVSWIFINIKSQVGEMLSEKPELKRCQTESEQQSKPIIRLLQNWRSDRPHNPQQIYWICSLIINRRHLLCWYRVVVRPGSDCCRLTQFSFATRHERSRPKIIIFWFVDPEKFVDPIRIFRVIKIDYRVSSTPRAAVFVVVHAPPADIESFQHLDLWSWGQPTSDRCLSVCPSACFSRNSSVRKHQHVFCCWRDRGIRNPRR
jgi:hypothetical protein